MCEMNRKKEQILPTFVRNGGPTNIHTYDGIIDQ